MITSPEGQTRSLCLHSLPAAQPHQNGYLREVRSERRLDLAFTGRT